jgi:hypothetical protein
MESLHYDEPPRPSKTTGLAFSLSCIALGLLALWAVLQLSPQQALVAHARENVLALLRLPESLEFLEEHTRETLAAVGLALTAWTFLRRPRR